MKNIKAMRKDFVGAKLYAIAENKQGDFHFILKKGKKCFGIKVNPELFDTFNYIEKDKK